MSKVFKVFLILIVSFYILSIPLVFINFDIFTNSLHSILNLRIKESYLGGEELVEFKDRINDDNGAGELTYPRSVIFKGGGSGLLDILSFTVYKPQTEEDWSRGNIYWQFNYKFKNLVGSKERVLKHPIITHYIGIEGIEMDGRNDTLHPRAELVSFKRPWHYVIEIFQDKAIISSADGNFNEEIQLLIIKNSLFTRLPLENPTLKHLFTKPKTYHYVLIGAYDYYTEGKYLPVKKKASPKSGGGAKSRLTPRVYDLIAPEGFKQSDILSGYNVENFTYVELEPVVADLKLEYKQGNDPGLPTVEELITKLEADEGVDPKELEKEHNELIDSLKGKEDVQSLLALGKSLFNIGNHEEAVKKFEMVFKADPENAIASAYLGSIRSKQASETDSIMKSMEYVNDAFDLFDKALKNTKTEEEELEVLLNRAYVAQSVPESVFKKSETGANDFLRVIEINNGLGKYEKLQYYYLMASLCFKQAGKIEESETYLNEAIYIGKID